MSVDKVLTAMKRLLPLMRSRAAGDAKWVAGGQILTAIAALVSVRLLTEVLDPDQFGRLQLLLGIAVFANALAVVPLMQAVIRFFPEWQRGEKSELARAISGRLVGRRVILLGLVVSIAWALVGPRYGYPGWIGVAISLLFLNEALRGFEFSLLSTKRRQKPIAIYSMLDAWLRPMAAVVLALFVASTYQMALLGYVLGAALVSVLFYLTVQLVAVEKGGLRAMFSIKPAGQDAEFAQKIRSSIWTYALPLMPMAIFGWVSGLGDRYIIGGIIGADQVGFYAAAYGLISRPYLMMSGITELTLRPILQDALADKDATRIKNTERTWVALIVGGSVVGFILIYLLQDLLVGLLLAERYRATALELIPWMALGFGFLSISEVFTRFCYAYSDTKAVVMIGGFGAVASMAVAFPAVSYFGLIGAAMAVPVYFFLQMAIAFLLANRARQRIEAGKAAS